MSKEIKVGDNVKVMFSTHKWPYAKSIKARVNCKWRNGDLSVAWWEDGTDYTIEKFMRVSPEQVSAIE